MSTNILLFGALFLITAATVIAIIRIEMRLNKLFKGSHADSLEALMADIVARVKKLNEQGQEQALNLDAIEQRLQKQGRAVKLIRFNPFTDVGGNQSFAVAIVNKEGDGVVFSSLYSRERMSVFAKPVTQGTSDIELTPEEQAVIADARKEASN